MYGCSADSFAETHVSDQETIVGVRCYFPCGDCGNRDPDAYDVEPGTTSWDYD